MSVSWGKIINSINEQSNKFLIAVSGGVDSMLLLDVINKSSIPKTNYMVVHFDHGIRDDSTDDARFVKQTCEGHGIKCLIGMTNNLKGKSNLEKLAREARWGYFENTAKLNGYDTVLTAHHLNDYVENYIMGNIRGISFDACVMPRLWRSNGVFRFKPWLMEINKKEIYEISKYRNIEWREDYTNKENDNLRNTVRNIIVPEMMKSHNVLKTIPNVISSIERKCKNA